MMEVVSASGLMCKSLVKTTIYSPIKVSKFQSATVSYHELRKLYIIWDTEVVGERRLHKNRRC